MIKELSISNIALIDALKLSFDAGFSALTGETGAGKSILVDAMNLALGGRADRELVRTGADRARVEAVFSLDENARGVLEDIGIAAPDDTVTIARELTGAGRSAARINGIAQPLSALKRLTAAMVDLHGQHEHQSLLDEEKHGAILDDYAPQEIAKYLAPVAEAHGAYVAARRELRSLTGDARDRALRADMLAFQIKEIEQAALKPGEEEALRQESDRLGNLEKILSAVNAASALLSGGERSRGAVSALHAAAGQMRSIEGYDDQYAQIAKGIEEAAYAAEDAAMGLSGLADEDELDPRRIDYVEQRLDDIRALKRKYGHSISDILAFHSRAQQEMDRLINSEEWAAKMEQQIAQLRATLIQRCEALSAARQRAAARYGEAVLAQLRDLGMEKARFLIEVEPPEEGFEEERLTRQGYDHVRFLFSANAGEPVKPLARIASGGEMSRVMLALKSVSAGDIGCLIFDEIDTGISGRMAQAVGEKIARLAKGRQVICVTHLPQIACMADTQYVVFKREEAGRAATIVQKLTAQGRVDEIARLVGGADGEQAAREHAAGMLKAAEKRKGEMD